MIFVNAFSHRKVISQSPSKISQACGATKEREEFKGGARDLGSSKLSKVAKNIFGFQKPTPNRLYLSQCNLLFAL